MKRNVGDIVNVKMKSDMFEGITVPGRIKKIISENEYIVETPIDSPFSREERYTEDDFLEG